MPEIVDLRRVNASGGAEAQVRQRKREGNQVRDALAKVVARGEKARQVDEMRAGRIDGPRSDQLEVEGALDRAARRESEARVEGIRAARIEIGRGICDVVGSRDAVERPGGRGPQGAGR